MPFPSFGHYFYLHNEEIELRCHKHILILQIKLIVQLVQSDRSNLNIFFFSFGQGRRLQELHREGDEDRGRDVGRSGIEEAEEGRHRPDSAARIFHCRCSVQRAFSSRMQTG